MKTLRNWDVEFAWFHLENPHVYDLLLRLAREAQAAGKTKLGVNTLYTRARWDLWLATKDRADPDLKLNDGYTSRYARLLMKEPGLEGFFEVRRLRSGGRG